MTTTTNYSPSHAPRRSAARQFIRPLTNHLILILVLLLSLLSLVPSAVVPASAPARDFSAARAMIHLREIAQHPHPTGSAENARVRAYLVAQLEGLGLQPEVQQATSVVHLPGISTVAVIHNVVARIRGTGAGDALLLMAHYDSVPTSPGASDDGSGVVAILEAVRALRAGPPLQNDVIVLLSDGEEIGLLGARAFADEHRWMDDVRLVINLEARGASGPVVLFESSAANAALIRSYAEVAPNPVTSSLLPDIYRLLPNDTDLTVFLRQGTPGLNFAYADDWTRYHTGRDDLDQIDERSVQHHGETLLALARHFGDQELDLDAESDAIFFSVLGRWVIAYPQSWVAPLIGLAALSLLGLLTLGRVRGLLSLRQVAFSTMALLGTAALLGALGYAGVQALNLLKANELSLLMGGTYHAHWYELGFLLLFVGVGGWLLTAAGRVLKPINLLAGALLIWMALTIASGLGLPGASYLFTWPLLIGLAVLALQLIASPRIARLASLLPALAAIVIVTPTIYLVLILAGINAVIIMGALVVLLLGLALPVLIDGDAQLLDNWLPSALSAGAGFALLLSVALTTGYDRAHPRQNMLFYSMDADRDKAAWVVAGQAHEPWAEGFTSAERERSQLAEHLPLLSGIGLEADSGVAPPIDALAPSVTLLEETYRGETRTVRLRIVSQRGAHEFNALIASPGGLSAATLFGKRVNYETPLPELMLNSVAMPPEGFELTLTLRRDQMLSVRIADVTPGLPALANHSAPPRPDTVTGVAGGFTPDAATLVQRTVVFPAQPR